MSLCGSDETDNVWQDTADVCDICPPVDTVGIVVRRGVGSNVQFRQVQETLLQDVVVAEDDTCNGGEEDGISTQVGGEHRR